jgi:hypothetical protein
MSHSVSIKDYQKLDNKDTSIHLPSDYSSKELSSSPNSSLSNESSDQQVSERRVVKSCFWSTTIFSLNFVSSIVVINLSKWYEG